MHNDPNGTPHEDYGGLLRDLRSTGEAMNRRQLLHFAASVGALALLGCNKSAATATDGGNANCSKIPQETAGPYPAEGSNGPNVLNQTGVVRSDIRSSFAGLSGSADGIPLTIALSLVSAASCAPLGARAVYLWHCDKLGRYSLYSGGVTNRNYLRGVQETDSTGRVSFISIFPACYAGRWPHIHFEVYPSLAAATNVANKIATSQIALPKAVCDAVYATAGYEQSVTNLSQITLANDMVFSDGSSQQLASMSGTVSGGYMATLTAAV